MLPADYGLFVEEFKNHPSGTIWIMKPTGSAQGKGIFLFTKLSAINEWKKDHTWKNAEDAKAAAAYVVQRYIENPQLIGGKKFDLRLYVLVTSYSPLTVYMYRNGFARFSSYRYNTNAKNLGDTFVHLTNVAVQKTGLASTRARGRSGCCATTASSSSASTATRRPTACLRTSRSS